MHDPGLPGDATGDAAPVRASGAAPRSAGERLIAIDVLRGLAILWVIVFHLHGDMTLRLDPGGRLYSVARDHLAAGQLLDALDALGELLLSSGYQGVAMFMMLSGISLVWNAERRGEPPALRGYWQRLRRIVPPYWFGIALVLVTTAVIAIIQMALHGGGFGEQWELVRANPMAFVRWHVDETLWALSVGGWLFRREGDVIAPFPLIVGSLWFVPLLLQYYLVYPVALRFLRRMGPVQFAIGALAITILARAVLIGATHSGLPPVWQSTMIVFGVFRFSEFAIGMSLGYLLAHRREAAAEWVRTPFDIGGLLVIAALLQCAGVVLAPKSETTLVLGDVLIQLALALYMAPLLFKRPGRLEVSAPAKALALMGVTSFMVLVINDSMRFYATLLRVEDVRSAVWWLFLTVVYVPGGVLLAYPLARLFGMVPRTAKAPAPVTSAPAPSLEFEPVPVTP